MKVAANTATGLHLGTRRGTTREPKRETERPVSLPAVVERPRPNRAAPSASRVRHDAALITQLIGGIENMPGSRIRRRAEPAESTEAYRRMATCGPNIISTRSTTI